MDPTTLALILFGAQIVQSFLGYLMKTTVDKHTKEMERQQAVTDALRSDLNDVKVNYVSKHEFGTFESRLWERFDRLEDKLDGRK